MEELFESGEMYLETMYVLKNQKGHVRSIDLANALGYSKPSVSRAIKTFKEKGLVTVEDKGYLEFTPEGLKIAQSVYDKHQVLTQFLAKIGVSEEQAEEDACRIEHVLSEETYQCIKAHMKQL